MHKTATTVAAIVTIGAGMFYLTTEIGKNLEADRAEKYEHAQKMCDRNEDVQKAIIKQAELVIGNPDHTRSFVEQNLAHSKCMKKYGFQ